MLVAKAIDGPVKRANSNEGATADSNVKAVAVGVAEDPSQVAEAVVARR
jgi:hypothetical protein